MTKPAIIAWKQRYAPKGLAGRPKSGRPRTVDDVEIVLRTLDHRRSTLA